MGTIQVSMRLMCKMDAFMSGEDFTSVTHMLSQMQEFVEQTEQDLLQGRERVGELRNQYQSLKENETALTSKKQQVTHSLITKTSKAAEAMTDSLVEQQPGSAQQATTLGAEVPTTREQEAPSLGAESSQETDLQHDSTLRTYLSK